MLRLVRSQLTGRPGRSAALLAGIVLACGSFAILISTARSQQVDVRGTVSRTYRSSYDILVRPAGSETALEKRDGLVRDNYLSGIFGGITMAQWHRIAGLAGVQVAAPIAMVGYIPQLIRFKVDLTRDLNGSQRQLFAVNVQRVADRGLVHLTDQTGYVYATSQPFESPYNSPSLRFGDYIEQLPGGRAAHDCPQTLSAGGAARTPFGPSEREIAWCWSRRTGYLGTGWQLSGFARGHYGFAVTWSFPFLLAAIDPVAESELDGINRTITTGRYLQATDGPTTTDTDGISTVSVPVIASTRSYLDDRDEVTVRKLSPSAADAMTRDHTLAQVRRQLSAAGRGTVVARVSFGAGGAYRQLLSTLSQALPERIQSYWSSGPARYRQIGPDRLAPVPVANPLSVWRSDYMGTGQVDAPIDATMTAYRPLHPHVGRGGLNSGITTILLPSLRAVGRFDPDRLPGFSALTALPQETYYPPVAAPADPRTRRLLGGRDLLPDSNPAGYLQAPPLLLTDLRALTAFGDPKAFPTGNAKDPISVIRVRVAGDRSDDAASRARVRAVAQEIIRATGLQVDITIGSSPTPVTIDLPGERSRPALELREGWVKKGVSVVILRALDRETKVLLLLILVVGALFAANAASAAVRARRTEFGVLIAVGWTRRNVLADITGELAAIGLAGGLLGAVLAVAVGLALDVHVAASAAVLAVPAALAITTAAGLVPALRAGGARPIAAVRPAILEAGRAHHVGGVARMSMINLVRVPGRTLLGITSLAIGVGGLTVLVGATLAFKNLLVGTLLGGAVSVQVSGSDYAAVAVIIVLSLAAIADVLYLNQRERATELATLRATGWTRRALARLTIIEGFGIALLGSVLGGGIGLAATTAISGSVPSTLLITTAAATGVGLLAGIGAALIPGLIPTRLPLARLLSAD
jgi:putative ABC transport system permease protein